VRCRPRQAGQRVTRSRSENAHYFTLMMHHQHLASLLIGLLTFLSGGENGAVVHGFSAPIIRGTATAVGTCQSFCPLLSPIARQSLDANNKTPTLQFLHRWPPRILPSSDTVVALQAEPTNNVDSDSSYNDANEIIARRIIVVGDVDGGYYRSCVKNEVSCCAFCGKISCRCSFL
jgi:hypothetical protein